MTSQASTEDRATAPLLLPLPYHRESASYFHTIHATLPTPVLLQSDAPSQTGEQRGRFDIISAAPQFTLSSRQGRVQYSGDYPLLPAPDTHEPQSPSFAALRSLQAYIESRPVDYSACRQHALPFCGGLIGYCSYDLAREYMHLTTSAADEIALDDMQFSFYSWACIQDHHQQCSWLVIHPLCDSSLQQTVLALFSDALRNETGKQTCDNTFVTLPLRVHSDTDREAYRQCFERIQHYIHAGDCYQINFARRFVIEGAGKHYDPATLYWHLRKRMPSPFCSYLPIQHSDSVILSFSPERFIQLDEQRRVLTQPIKGTIARDLDPLRDAGNAMQLQHDEKNRAENVMIVDLLRNDIGKVCKTGSVKVTALCELQSFANVHHLVSSVTGELMAGLNAADLLHACFPGGSITGAPKKRAMEIIEELESHRRGIYCGCIAYLSAHGAMDSNITIRTVLHHEGQVYCWGGGGIVADSNLQAEYDEIDSKIGMLINGITTLRQ